MLNANFLEELNVIKLENNTFSSFNKSKYFDFFDNLKKIGTVKNTCNFFDDSWIFKVGGLENKFTFFSSFYLKKISNFFSMSIDEFDLAYRSYVAYYIASKSDISRLNYILKSVVNSGLDALHHIGLQYVNPFLEFCEYIKVSKEFAKKLDSYVFNLKRKNCNSKTLPKFDDIFAFAEIINDITLNKNLDDYFEYFPIFLWWKITSIIPNRPTEFLSLDFNCIFEEDGKCSIKIKRSKAKSSLLIKKRFDLDDYYTTETILINKSLYDFIFNYQNKIKKICSNTPPELLIPGDIFLKYRYAKNEVTRELNSETFTDVDLYALLRKFYSKVVSIEYGKIPISTFESANKVEDTIERLTPYDTRHIAIINLILLGNEPQTVMELAGHETITTTQGYYNHIETFSNSYAISYGKKLKLQKKSELQNIKSFSESNSQKTLNIVLNKSSKEKVDGGFCCYPNIKKDKTKCYKVEGNHSICDYFLPNNDSVMNSVRADIQDEISIEVKVLQDLVKNYKTISNFSENYSVSVSKLDKLIRTLTLLESKQ